MKRPGTSFSHEDTAPGLTTLGEYSPGMACINISPGTISETLTR